MATALSPNPSGASQSSTSLSQPQPPSAPPPSRIEIERKLSFKAKSPPQRTVSDSPKKPKKAQGSLPIYPASGNESDSSSITSSSQHPTSVLTSPTFPSSPLLAQSVTSPTGGHSLSAIAERQAKGNALSGGELIDEELEDVEEEGDGDGDEGEESEDVEVEGGDLQRGMEGERVLKSGYLFKKQERRKASLQDGVPLVKANPPQAWKRRWFVLRTGKLAYYKDDREYSLKRVIDLKSIHTVAPVTVKKHSFAFGIVTSKRTFLAKASSQEEMDDWVRALNGARRKLSEREEEARNRRVGSVTSPIAVPTSKPNPLDPIDTHQGTYGSVFSSTTGGSISASPIATGGYFTPHPPSMPQHPFHSGASPMSSPAILPPASPMDTTNSLSTQMAMMNMSKTGSSSSGPSQPPRLPSMAVGTGGFGTRKASTASISRREPSASSISSSVGGPSGFTEVQGLSINTSQMPSSDEDEPYFSDPGAAFPTPTATSQPMLPVSAPVDPKKIILSAYLMKRSKGRGRKVWRKRWFYLTSQGLTYTKSHMDSRALRFIPLTAVLDALEFDPNSSADDDSDSEPENPNDSSGMNRSRQSRQSITSSMRGAPMKGVPSWTEKVNAPGQDENLFKLVTAKRTFVLCAPSEEDEIKWLAAFRALLTRQREWSSQGDTPTSAESRVGEYARPGQSQVSNVPFITQQPPTPATGSIPDSARTRDDGEADRPPPTPSVNTAQGPPVLERPIDTTSSDFTTTSAPGNAGSLGMRGRSATYIAKGAVADVVRRFHPDQQ